jgi:hypothetical protein
MKGLKIEKHRLIQKKNKLEHEKFEFEESSDLEKQVDIDKQSNFSQQLSGIESQMVFFKSHMAKLFQDIELALKLLHELELEYGNAELEIFNSFI